MDVITFDLFLIITGLILTAIILFLSLVSVIYTVRLAYKMDTLVKLMDTYRPVSKIDHPLPGREPRAREGTPGTAAQESVTIPGKTKFDPARDAPDIPTGMRRLCEIYRFESLTLSSPDGLVVASSGHSSADEDAARISYALMTGSPLGERNLSFFPMEYKGSEMVAIIRRSEDVPEGNLDELKKDICSLLEKWL